MPDQHKNVPESCQARHLPASRASRSVASQTSRGLAAALGRCRAIRDAAFCRRAVQILLLLSAFGLNAPRVLAETSNHVSDSSRTEDHVHVTVRRAGDTTLITLRIDPGYHVNANPASNEYLIPTSIAFEGVTPAWVAYPPAIPFKPAFVDEPIDVYEGSVVIAATFLTGALDRSAGLKITVTAQACTEQVCLPPAEMAVGIE